VAFVLKLRGISLRLKQQGVAIFGRGRGGKRGDQEEKRKGTGSTEKPRRRGNLGGETPYASKEAGSDRKRERSTSEGMEGKGLTQ